ncbi:HesB/IscA family protein [Brevibacillus fluminis]|uniref:HesB/IscA family protein n=1 Tax=Brevibacillus fluminis TaxID=511487 RepID=UPI003F8BA801
MITITPAASALLRDILAAETDADALGIKVLVTTTGCSSYSFSIAMTEPGASDRVTWIDGIRLLTTESEEAFLDGLIIDRNRENGRLQIFHPTQLQGGCSLP